MAEESEPLQDAKLGVVHAPNAITRSAQSHMTMATKDGVQNIEAFHVYAQPEGIGYLVRAFFLWTVEFCKLLNQNLTI